MSKPIIITAFVIVILAFIGSPNEQSHALVDGIQKTTIKVAPSASHELTAQSFTLSDLKVSQPVVSNVATISTFHTDAEAKAYIYQHESGNNPGSINKSSGACGLGQSLPCSKMPCSLTDYVCQDQFFTNYMLGRYGTWIAAANWWVAYKWW